MVQRTNEMRCRRKEHHLLSERVETLFARCARMRIDILFVVGVRNLMGELLSNCVKGPSQGGWTYAQHASGVVLVISETPYANMTSVVVYWVPQRRRLEPLVHHWWVAVSPVAGKRISWTFLCAIARTPSACLYAWDSPLASSSTYQAHLA